MRLRLLRLSRYFLPDTMKEMVKLAKDVGVFLTWAASPEHDLKKKMAVKVSTIFERSLIKLFFISISLISGSVFGCDCDWSHLLLEEVQVDGFEIKKDCLHAEDLSRLNRRNM